MITGSEPIPDGEGHVIGYQPVGYVTGRVTERENFRAKHVSITSHYSRSAREEHAFSPESIDGWCRLTVNPKEGRYALSFPSIYLGDGTGETVMAYSGPDLRLEEREVGSTSAKYLTSVDAAVGHEVNRLVREGIMLTEPMLQNPVIMQAGVQIYIVANVNGVRIKTEGVTLQRGREGDIIRVRNVHSSKVLRAKVLDATTVEVLQ